MLTNWQNPKAIVILKQDLKPAIQVILIAIHTKPIQAIPDSVRLSVEWKLLQPQRLAIVHASENCFILSRL